MYQESRHEYQGLMGKGLDHALLCMLIGVDFGDEIMLREEECKPRKISNFQEKKWQKNNNKNNCQNGSGKPRKFSRSRMTKRIAPLNLFHEI